MFSNNASSRESLFIWLCRQEMDTNSSEENTKIKAGFSKFTGEADVSQSKFNQWKLNSCGTVTHDFDSSADNFYFLKSASPVIADKWKDCMRRNNYDLLCWATKKDEQNAKIEFHVEWGFRYGNLTDIFFDLDNLEKIRERPFPTLIIPGESVYVLKRTDLNKEGSVVFEGHASNAVPPFAVSCTYSIPPVIQAPERIINTINEPRKRCMVKVGETRENFEWKSYDGHLDIEFIHDIFLVPLTYIRIKTGAPDRDLSYYQTRGQELEELKENYKKEIANVCPRSFIKRSSGWCESDVRGNAECAAKILKPYFDRIENYHVLSRYLSPEPGDFLFIPGIKVAMDLVFDIKIEKFGDDCP
ncbi:MAG: hypothetical protein HQK53_15295 [Oligoflexia bacterium]|nr:hypothetical protein [Oligoflexia bacterium]